MGLRGQAGGPKPQRRHGFRAAGGHPPRARRLGEGTVSAAATSGPRSIAQERPVTSQQSSALVQKLWSHCQVLRDDGLSYQDYLEQLTFLLFLKMADERADLTGEEQPVPKGYRWADLVKKE